MQELSHMWAWASPLLSGHHHRIKGRDGSQGYGTEALRGRSELILFPLSTFSPLLEMAPSPQKRAVLEQQEPKQTSTGPGLGTCWDGHGTPIRALDHAWSAFASVSHGRLHPVHMCVGSKSSPSHPRDHCPQHEHLWKLHQTRGAGAGIWGGLGQELRQLWETGLSPRRFRSGSSAFFRE